jgi:hypothetical protein
MLALIDKKEISQLTKMERMVDTCVQVIQNNIIASNPIESQSRDLCAV